MNKTVSVNISGLIFNIEEQAYEALKKYLDRIRKYLNNSEGSEEVIQDIESRIGELFMENINDRKEVINNEDVDRVIQIMGKPEDYVDGELDDNSYSENSKNKNRKRLFRDPDNQIIGGVCAGLSNYFGWQPIGLRIFLVLLFIFAGFGFLAYIILWIVMPKAETTAEKIQMHGEPVTVENIKKVVDEGVDALLGKDSGHSLKGSRTQSIKDGLSRVLKGIIDFFRVIFSVIGKIVGALFLIFGLVALVILVFGIADLDLLSFNESGLGDTLTLKDAREIFIGDSSISRLFTLGTVMTIFAPLTALVYAGLKLVFRISGNSKAMGAGLFVIFFTGIALLGYSGLKLNNEHKRTETAQFFEEIRSENNSLRLFTNENSADRSYRRGKDFYSIEDEDILMNEVEFTILKSPHDSIIQLEILKSSNGLDNRDAKERIENIEYNWSQNGDRVIFDSHMTIAKSDLIRNQNVDLVLRLPIGAQVFLDESMRRIIYNIDNVHDMYDRNMLGHTWIMKEEGLRCTDCGFEEEKEEENLENTEIDSSENSEELEETGEEI